MLAAIRQSGWFGTTLAALCALQVALFFVFVAATYVRYPVWDLLDWVIAYLDAARDGAWAHYLWHPHNEHRVIVSRLLMAVDITLFHGTGIPFVVFGALALAVMVVMLVREICRACLPRDLALAVGAAAVFAYSASQLSVLISMAASGVFVHTMLFVILAVVLCDGAGESPQGAIRRMLAILCAVCAPFGVAAGLLIWPVMIWIAWRGRLGLMWLIAVAAIGVAEWIVYLHGDGVPAGRAIDAASILDMADYAVRLLGLPFSRSPSLAWLGRLLGLACLLSGGFVLLAFARIRPTRLQRIGTAMILFAFLIAASAAYARSLIAPDHGVPVRYSIFAATGQLGILLAVAEWVAQRVPSFGARTKAAIVAAAAVLVAQQVAVGVTAADVAGRYAAQWKRFSDGQPWTPEMDLYAYPSRERAEFGLQLLKREHLYGAAP